ncbi:type I secretion system permease/ATPase [Thiomicrorhabdus indica]|uniref:type I secretion system permease/ATPase n=1 Tax=Thiomicrorhabdus indica TaxID=2267253 RepID=UPI002AA758C8|nr:type I secretion system permease/ATPase [Thiomicrorhabdus indica]
MNEQQITEISDKASEHIEIQDALLECLVIYTKQTQHPYSKDALVAGLPIESGRLTPDLFIRAARRAQLNASFKKRTLEEIPSLVLPCILTLKDQKACLLQSIDYEKSEALVIFSDAPDGWKKVSLHSLKEDYLGYAIYLTHSHQRIHKQETLIDSNKGHWFWSTVWLSRPIYRDVLIASFVINLFVLANPLFVMNVYDRIVPNNAMESLWVLVIGISVVYLFDILLKYLRSYFLEIAAKKSDVLISAKLFEQTLGLTSANRTGTIGAFANNLKEFDSIRSFLTSSTIAALVDLPFVIIFLTVIFYIAGQIVWVPILIILVMVIYSLALKGPIQKSIEATFEAQNQKNSVLIETLSAMPTIKALGVESRMQWKWEQAVGEIARTSLKSKMLQSSVARMTGYMQQMSTVLVVLAGVYLIQDGALTMGGLIAAVILSQRAISPMGQVASLLGTYQQTKTAFESLDALMAKEIERPNDKRFIEHPVFEGAIEFVNVTFTYPGESKPTLNNVSFKIKPRERVGIIGRIGSGKSTIEKLILGFYPVDSGSILIDGIDINQLDPAELRRNMNYVPQDVFLFRGDIRENIVYRAPFVEDDVLLKASKLAGVDDFVRKHPSGYGLAVNEGGSNLSGGQRQSIGIARALLLDAPFLMMDEPTNAMDGKTEQKLIQRLQKVQSDATTLLVTHKMSLLVLVDRLLVLEDGKLLSDGPKDEVLQSLNAKTVAKGASK